MRSVLSEQQHSKDDGALVAAYRSGDDGALSALVRRHQARVYRLALGVLASPQDAEDAAQEALVAMLGALPRFRGDSRFSTWLYRLTLNTCLKRRARAARNRERPLPEAVDVVAGAEGQPEALAGRVWLNGRVAGFLAALPDTYRLPVVLSDAAGLPSSEIAGTLGISLAAAKARVVRGRQRLREEVQRYCAEAGLRDWRELVG